MRSAACIDRAWIDPNRCERGLDCLKNYRYHWKDKQRIWTAYPLHDWASHGADALAIGQKRREGSFSASTHWAS
jgi:hypothetical protein